MWIATRDPDTFDKLIEYCVLIFQQEEDEKKWEGMPPWKRKLLAKKETEK